MASKPTFDYFMVKAVTVVGGGGLIFGYDIAVISGALGPIKAEFNLSDVQEGLIVSFIYVGAVFGSMWGGYLADRIGRWNTIHLQNLIFVAGAVCLALSSTVAQLYFGRFVVGIAAALSGIADVPYLLEISLPHKRGPVTAMYEVLVCVGVLMSNIVCLCLNGTDSGWRWMLAIPASMAVLQSIGMLFLPESPKWLAEHGYKDQAAEAWRVILASSSASAVEGDNGQQSELGYGDTPPLEFNHDSSMNTSGVRDASSRSGSSDCPSEVVEDTYFPDRVIFKQYFYPLFISVAVQILSQLTGGVVVRNYAPRIFEQAGYRDTVALEFNVGLGVMKLAVSMLSAFYMESIGRKRLLSFSAYVVGLGMLVLSIGFFAGESSASLFMTGCSLAIAGYSFGYGSVPWVLSAEMFPTRIRGIAMSVSLIASNATQGVVNFAFLPLIALTSPGLMFGLFFAMNLVTLVFVLGAMVETKEVEPYEILSALRATWLFSLLSWLCCCGRDEWCVVSDAEASSQHGLSKKAILQASSMISNSHEESNATEKIVQNPLSASL